MRKTKLQKTFATMLWTVFAFTMLQFAINQYLEIKMKLILLDAIEAEQLPMRKI